MFFLYKVTLKCVCVSECLSTLLYAYIHAHTYSYIRMQICRQKVTVIPRRCKGGVHQGRVLAKAAVEPSEHHPIGNVRELDALLAELKQHHEVRHHHAGQRHEGARGEADGRRGGMQGARH